MTSVPSLRLPLNGSKLLLLVLICGLVASCGTQRRSQRKPPVAAEPPKQEIPLPEVKETPSPAKPEAIRITYMLPFNADEIPYDSLGNVTKKLAEPTRVALDYYRGALMALDTIQKAGVKLKVFTYDTREDTNNVKTLFAKQDVQQSHLIIGPVYNPQLETAAPLANKYKVPLLSPFSTINDFVRRNPYYILANSTLETHCQLLYDYIVEHHQPVRVILLYNDNETEHQFANYFHKHETVRRNGVQLINLTDSSELTYNEVEQMLSDSGDNIIIIPSTSETFVGNIVRKLSGLTDKYSLNVYGMPQWRDAKSLRTDLLDQVNARITAAVWFDKNDPAIKQFSDRFTSRYGSAPSEIALEGYNQTLFFTSFMVAKGNRFDEHLSNYTMTTAGESFHFENIRRQPLFHTEKAPPPIDFIENRSVHILEYKGGKLVRIR